MSERLIMLSVLCVQPSTVPPHLDLPLFSVARSLAIKEFLRIPCQLDSRLHFTNKQHLWAIWKVQKRKQYSYNYSMSVMSRNLVFSRFGGFAVTSRYFLVNRVLWYCRKLCSLLIVFHGFWNPLPLCKAVVNWELREIFHDLGFPRHSSN